MPHSHGGILNNHSRSTPKLNPFRHGGGHESTAGDIDLRHSLNDTHNTNLRRNNVPVVLAGMSESTSPFTSLVYIFGVWSRLIWVFF